MRKKIVTIGRSAGVTVSPAEMRELGLEVGDPVEVNVRSGVFEMRPLNKYVGMPMTDVIARINQARTRQ
jgi:antitoxin component of MazEF toxin-antitoxin module